MIGGQYSQHQRCDEERYIESMLVWPTSFKNHGFSTGCKDMTHQELHHITRAQRLKTKKVFHLQEASVVISGPYYRPMLNTPRPGNWVSTNTGQNRTRGKRSLF